jgi:hypothetical protein
MRFASCALHDVANDNEHSAQAIRMMDRNGERADTHAKAA